MKFESVVKKVSEMIREEIPDKILDIIKGFSSWFECAGGTTYLDNRRDISEMEKNECGG